LECAAAADGNDASVKSATVEDDLRFRVGCRISIVCF
jgi:hypothetical protein